MSDTALTTRGITDAATGNVLVGVVAKPGAGRIDLNVVAGTQPLGREDALHHLDQVGRAILAVWPDAEARLVGVLDDAWSTE